MTRDRNQNRRRKELEEENPRLRASHERLLAAAKEAYQLLGLICEDEHEVRDALLAAIAAAEELAP